MIKARPTRISIQTPEPVRQLGRADVSRQLGRADGSRRRDLRWVDPTRRRRDAGTGGAGEAASRVDRCDRRLVGGKLRRRHRAVVVGGIDEVTGGGVDRCDRRLVGGKLRRRHGAVVAHGIDEVTGGDVDQSDGQLVGGKLRHRAVVIDGVVDVVGGSVVVVIDRVVDVVGGGVVVVIGGRVVVGAAGDVVGSAGKAAAVGRRRRQIGRW
jgi:hypothetical protein